MRQCARTPEPVGVPAPQIVADREPVGGAFLNGPIEDVHSGVITDGPRRSVWRPNVRYDSPALEHHAVEVVDAFGRQTAVGDDPVHRVLQFADTAEPDVPQRDKGCDGLQLDPQPNRISQRVPYELVGKPHGTGRRIRWWEWR